MNILYLIRGLPGVGKSTLAEQLSDDRRYPIFEADQFFMKNEQYDYRASEISLAHAQCQTKTKMAMLPDGYNNGEHFRLPSEIIIVANTFIIREHMFPYYHMAKEYGYRVVEIAISGPCTNKELAARNAHKVPEEVIERMRRQWQP